MIVTETFSKVHAVLSIALQVIHMANPYFQFKQFTVQQDASAMKVTTDACLFGAWCAAEIAESSVGETVLDIGTGTGLLSLMIRQKNNVAIDAVEIETAAAAQAIQNVAASPWEQHIHVINRDVLRMDVLKSYDYIVSNPPFYTNDLQSPDQKRNTAHHSHQLTWQDLVQFISKHLKQNGLFFLLLPYRRYVEATTLLHSNALFIYKEVLVHQTPEHQPFRVLLKGGRIKAPKESSVLTINGSPKQYTPAFTNLLKDYYLYL